MFLVRLSILYDSKNGRKFGILCAMQAKVDLETPLSEIRGMNSRFLEKLKRLKIETVHDLLWHLPTRYEDFSAIYTIADLIPHQEATICGVVQNIRSRRTWHRNLYLMEAEIADETGSIRAIWFNQPYIKNILQPGRKANFSGKIAVSKKEGDLYLSNPTYELVRDYEEQETRHTGRIVPIYPETRGFTSKGLRFLIKPILDELPELPDIIPADILEEEGFYSLRETLKNVHFPEQLEDAIVAKKRFAFEDLFLLQLWNVRERLRLAHEKARAIPIDDLAIQKIISSLPFPLTETQQTALGEILTDLKKKSPMNRLMQGDVGSGKTIVAAIAALQVAEAGHQVAFMAPTEILARQHFKTLTSFFPNFEHGLALLTSSDSQVFYGHDLISEPKKLELSSGIRKNSIRIVIGTHALIQKSVTFADLGLVVVDEQHRFGVEQRDLLLKNGRRDSDSKVVPHFLSMSATPIPRTLNLTLFGNLDVSLITELPKNRKPIITKYVAPANREQAHALIRGEVKKGRQVFVICPRIEPPDPTSASQSDWKRLERKSVKEEYEKLSKKVFPNLRVAMLHGKMSGKTKTGPSKESVMKAFSGGEIDVLVATSVIEVGIDVPNATIMMIENAERFGLAQLYQFRGRVGRGSHQSFCFLFGETSTDSANERLKAIVEAKNGFELAERDLMIRGPGEFLGSSQSGMPDLAMKAIQNPELVSRARISATRILTRDPNLKKYPELKKHLLHFQKALHEE